MERPPWRWNMGFLATSAAVALLACALVAVFTFLTRPPWAAALVGLAVIAVAGTLAAAAYVPVGVAVTGDALHLRYLRRRTVVPWRDVLGVLAVGDSLSIKTAGRRIRLEHPGTIIEAELLRAARVHGIGADRPEERPGRESVLPPPGP